VLAAWRAAERGAKVCRGGKGVGTRGLGTRGLGPKGAEDKGGWGQGVGARGVGTSRRGGVTPRSCLVTPQLPGSCSCLAARQPPSHPREPTPHSQHRVSQSLHADTPPRARACRRRAAGRGTAWRASNHAGSPGPRPRPPRRAHDGAGRISALAAPPGRAADSARGAAGLALPGGAAGVRGCGQLLGSSHADDACHVCWSRHLPRLPLSAPHTPTSSMGCQTVAPSHPPPPGTPTQVAATQRWRRLSEAGLFQQPPRRSARDADASPDRPTVAARMRQQRLRPPPGSLGDLLGARRLKRMVLTAWRSLARYQRATRAVEEVGVCWGLLGWRRCEQQRGGMWVQHFQGGWVSSW